MASERGTLRRRALDAARALLEESGPEGLHLRTIAAKAGSGAASLYYHFADKEALLAALAIEGWGELALKIGRAMESGKSPHKIDAASGAFLTFINRNLQLYALMQAERALAGNESVREAEQLAFSTFQSSLLDDDRVPADRVEDIALVCWVLGRGIASTMLMNGDVDPGQARGFVERVLNGFGFMLSSRFTG